MSRLALAVGLATATLLAPDLALAAGAIEGGVTP